MSTASDADLELSASRWIPASPQDLWVACTTKAGLERWWSPEDLRTSVRRLDARDQGTVVLHIAYTPALLSPSTTESFTAARIPIAFDLRGRLVDVVEPKRITFDLTLDIGRSGAGVEMRTTLEFAEEGAGTRVTIVGRGAGTPHWAALGKQNLEGQLERLERSVGQSV
jgi:uncharacterized protein YndB with AHSA1/START domain